MQGTAILTAATEMRLSDDDILRAGDDQMYIKSIQRLKHFNELGDKVIDTYLKKICQQFSVIKSCSIPSLYAQNFMDNECNYISDQRTLMHLSQVNILGSVLVFLPI